MRGTLERALASGAAAVSLIALSSTGALAASRHARRHRAGAHASGHARAHRSAHKSTTLSSPQLWATVDVCHKGPHPVIGVRGSMPADGRGRDVMYMRFGVEYLDASTKEWAAVQEASEASFTRVGIGLATRQAGRNFHLARPAGSASYQLRGVVEYQWRRGAKVVLSAKRHTTAGHGATVLHASPSGFSAASCTVA